MPPTPSHDDAEFIRAYLAGRDVPCPACGYNLRGLASDRCPECSRGLSLTLGLVDRGLGTLVAAAVGLGAAGSAAAALLGVVFWLSWSEKGFPDGDELVVLVLVPGLIVVAAAVAVALLVRRRRRFLSRSRRARLLTVGACWAASVAQVTGWTWLLAWLL